MKNLKIFYLPALFLLMLAGSAPQAAIVRMSVLFGTTPQGDIYIEMFDIPSGGRTAAPVTVANFLNYIDDGNGTRRYDGSFIHRNAKLADGSNFVVQGGGYKYDPSLGAFSTTTAPHIPVDAAIVNEFDASRSNLRGTVAMAKLGGDPNSATSEWFFNMADNSANLDNQNGGFTVFGQVLGNGMNIVDSIAALPISNQGGAFSSLPVNNLQAGNPVTTDNLVTIQMAASPYPPPLFVSPAPVDFGLVTTNLSPLTQKLVTLVNTGSVSVNIGVIGGINPLAAPFAIVAGLDNCSNQTLASFSSCTLAISFDPQTTATLLQDSLDIPYDDGTPSSLTLDVSGSGALPNPILEITPNNIPLDFGTVALADFSEQQVTIRNVGTGDLQLGTIDFTGANAADFSIMSDSPLNCKTSALALSETCILTVRFTGGALGSRTATLNINASPGSQLAQLTLNGNVIASQADLVLPVTNNTIDIGDTRSDLAKVIKPPFGNQGTEDLIFTAFNILGADASQFSIDSTACQRVAPNQSCETTITFTPSGTGPRTATLEIQTNDPDTPVASLTLNATSSTDNDGIPDAIEMAAPNGGDGNQDGIADVQQENVSSFPDINGTYVALESSVGTRLTNVAAINNPGPNTTPTVSNGSVTFPQGFYSYTLENVPVGGQATVTLYLAAGTSVNSYFKFGRFPTEVPSFFFPEHWYQFDLQGQPQTGAEFLPDRIVLHLIDGGRGDNDQTADGIIVDPGGPALVSVGSSSSSAGCTLANHPDSKIRVDWWLVFLFISLLYGRALFKMPHRKQASLL